MLRLGLSVLAVVSFLLPAAMHADPVLYDLSVVFQGGNTLTGTLTNQVVQDPDDPLVYHQVAEVNYVSGNVPIGYYYWWGDTGSDEPITYPDGILVNLGLAGDRYQEFGAFIYVNSAALNGLGGQVCSLTFNCGGEYLSNAWAKDPFGGNDIIVPALSGSIIREGVTPSAVPEPAELTLLLTGLGAGAGLLRRRRSSKEVATQPSFIGGRNVGSVPPPITNLQIACASPKRRRAWLA